MFGRGRDPGFSRYRRRDPRFHGEGRVSKGLRPPSSQDLEDCVITDRGEASARLIDSTSPGFDFLSAVL